MLDIQLLDHVINKFKSGFSGSKNISVYWHIPKIPTKSGYEVNQDTKDEILRSLVAEKSVGQICNLRKIVSLTRMLQCSKVKTIPTSRS